MARPRLFLGLAVVLAALGALAFFVVRATAHQAVPETPGGGSVCVTSMGACMLPYQAPRGSSCVCRTPYGPAYGVVS